MKKPYQTAFVTLLMLNDSYLPGVLLQAYQLRLQATQADLLCLVTPEISPAARQALAVLFDFVVEVPPIYVPHDRAQRRQYLPFVFTKLHALRLGQDGDLGFAYDRVVLLDADLLPLRQFDDLLKLPAPAGVMNEHKSHMLAAENGRFLISPTAARQGTWHWHEIYADCPHGRPIPQALTDRVAADPANMGINGALLVMAPSLAEYRDMRRDLECPATQHLVGSLFDWPDMQYLTMVWSGRWHNVDVRYASLNGYPDLRVLYGTHFAGLKPWQHGRTASLAHYGRYPDFQYWFRQYHAMLTDHHPGLQRCQRLRRLLLATQKV
ncbi:MAG: hypothetical protein KC441_07700 [Anaerolineales bacterium]|nr:hypothetical protein [Anaerolineales bacterium]